MQKKTFTQAEQKRIRKAYEEGISLREIAKELQCGQRRIRIFLRNNNIPPRKRHQKYTYNLNAFYREDSITYYLLGAFCTDGNITLQNRRAEVSICSRDKDWIEVINQVICPETKISKNGKNCWRATYYSVELANWFISHGCTPAKSLTIQFPEVPQKYLADFIRGCWDGDGTISFNIRRRKDTKQEYSRQAVLYTGSEDFADGMRKSLAVLGINSFITKQIVKDNEIDGRIITTDKPHYNVRISSGEDIYNLLKIIYYPNYSLGMARKAAVATTIVGDWEQVRHCEMCENLIPFNKYSRHQKYCELCAADRKRVQTQEYKRRKLNQLVSAPLH